MAKTERPQGGGSYRRNPKTGKVELVERTEAAPPPQSTPEPAPPATKPTPEEA